MLVVVLKNGKQVAFNKITTFSVSRWDNSDKIIKMQVFKDGNVIAEFNGSSIDGYYLTAYTTDGNTEENQEE